MYAYAIIQNLDGDWHDLARVECTNIRVLIHVDIPGKNSYSTCVVYRPTREFIIHMEMSPLLVKGCKFRLMLDTHGH